MAVMDDTAAGVALDEFHLGSPNFDALLDQNGSPVLLRFATRCPCRDLDTGRPDPACTNCYPYGVLWDEPIETKCFGPNRKPMRRPDAAGEYSVGDAFFTFKTNVMPTPGSRFLLPLSEITVDDVLVKGREDVIRYADVVSVEKALCSRRVPPSGHPYTVDVVPLVIGTDIVINGREVTWLNPGLPDGTVYTVRLRARVEYLVFEPQDRNEDGKPLPYRYLCRRLDYLLHPRGQKAVSF